jgi:hypothetical protein
MMALIILSMQLKIILNIFKFMAISLKTGLTYTDDFGNTSTEYYGVIDVIQLNKHNKFTSIVLEIYASKSARDQSLAPVQIKSYNITNDQFDIWYSLAVLNQPNNNPFKQSYSYLSTLAEWQDWQAI